LTLPLDLVHIQPFTFDLRCIISQLKGIITEILHLWREIASFKAISAPLTLSAKREPARGVSAVARNLNRRAKLKSTSPESLFGGKTVNVPNSKER